MTGDNAVVYRNQTYEAYWDISQVPNTTATVMYTASETLSPKECDAETSCRRNVVEEVNLTTGEVDRLYTRTYSYYPVRKIGQVHTVQWHDVDREDGRLYVADMATDEVFAVNLSTGIVEWTWVAESAYDREGGGPFPYDWTHVNDVETLDDGRVMVSLRNQDQVIFLDPETGVVEDWTLGAEDEYDVLNEQHNPVYIPVEDGGPAVIVADSTNNRLVEYQRVDGAWERTWEWQDARMQWPRDADRLPNGNTLVTDSAGHRVMELDRSGSIVWSVDVTMPYEAERLGTGEESEGGQSARRLDLANSTISGPGPSDGDSDGSILGQVKSGLISLLPNKLVHSLEWALPRWAGFYVVGATAAAVLVVVLWVYAELRWRGVELDVDVELTVGD